ncbi:MAG TPA: zinc ribbon domain-containing protein [Ktedonobacteraceae bacterium]|nr:zinc ribbon domain-containing protein [Ktedonobacteraceae bacterium]
MQHCTVCGSEIPDDARFCSKCGHTHNQVSTIDEETTNTDTSSAKGEQSEDVTALSTQELAHSEGAANGHQSEDVTAVSTQELAHAKEEEHVQKPEDVTEINTQELAHAEDGEREEGGVSEEPAVMEAPAPSQEAAAAAEPGAQISTPQAIEDEAESEPTIQNSLSPASKARRGSGLRWVLLAIVCILVLAGSAGALLFFLHQQTAATSAAPLVGTSPTSSTGTTPLNTACPTTTGSKSTPCATTIMGLTPVAGTKSVFNITFSGAVKGDMTVTSLARCGPSTSGTEYDLYFIGSVGGTQYTYVSRVPTYKGPATYGTGQVSVVFAQQPLSTTAVWGNSGNAPATVTINSDLKSGSMEVDLAGASNSVHISGNWACA